MPQVGLGVWQTPPEDTERAVATALDAGYRHVDTAAGYFNEREVGKAVTASGLPREDVFITTKLWNADQGYDSTLAAFDASMDTARIVRVPRPLPHSLADAGEEHVRRHIQGVRTPARPGPHPVDRRQQFRTRTPANPGGRHRHRSGGQPDRAASATASSRNCGKCTLSWASPPRRGAPLGQGSLLSNPTVTAVADAHGKTPAQVLIRWHIQLGNIVIPKSVTPERIVSNFDVFDFELSEQDMASISSLGDGTRLGPDPRTFNFTG